MFLLFIKPAINSLPVIFERLTNTDSVFALCISNEINNRAQPNFSPIDHGVFNHSSDGEKVIN
ncbi:hypothetical protein A0E43_06240 [Pectobacterium cacticida]